MVLNPAQFRRSINYSEFWVGEEDLVQLQAMCTQNGIDAGRDLSDTAIVVRLRFYDVGTSTTLLADFAMSKVVDPDLGGTAGATGIAQVSVRFTTASEQAVAYWIAVDTGTTDLNTPSGKREVRLCKPWQVVVYGVPVTA